MRVPFCPADPSSAVALRIRRADTVIEVSGDAPDNILAFLKAVMTDVVLDEWFRSNLSLCG